MSPDLHTALRTLLPETHILTTPEAMRPYLAEQRDRYHGTAQAVLRPSTTEEMAAVVRVLAERGIPMVPQGGNTGLCGGAVPTAPAVVLSTERLNRIRALDPLNNTLTAEAGCILAQVQDAAAAQDRLFPLSLAAEGSCRIGGTLSTNAGGLNVLHYGNARDLVLGLEVVLPDGQIWHGLRGLRKDNTGYDLKHLFIGAEGTLGIVTAAVLKLFPRPRSVETALVALPSVAAGLEVLNRVRTASGDNTTACELMGAPSIAMAQRYGIDVDWPLAAIPPWSILLEVSSAGDFDLRTPLETTLAQALSDGLVLDAVVARSEAQRTALWRLRESIPAAQKGAGGSIKHDVSVPVSRIPVFLDRATAAVERAIPGVRVVAFGHVGDGNIHFNLSQPEAMDKSAFLALWEETNRLVHDIVQELDGSISAEHGIGCLKIDELARTKDPVELAMMRAIKTALDPRNLMNPGKILSPQ